MYTIYIKVVFETARFSCTLYTAKTVENGVPYSFYNDKDTYEEMCDKVQLELDEFYSPTYRSVELCDIDWFVITKQDYIKSNDMLKI